MALTVNFPRTWDVSVKLSIIYESVIQPDGGDAIFSPRDKTYGSQLNASAMCCIRLRYIVRQSFLYCQLT